MYQGTIESEVRSYCRAFPELFTRAKDSFLYSSTGKQYIDFFAGAGALNYGHNNEYIKREIIDYLHSDGLTHGLDMFTTAKEQFLKTFQNIILRPRNLNYKVQFCGPTGTNAVEAALKLARKITDRTGIMSFMGGFHGMSMGSLSVTSNLYHRGGSGVPLNNVTFVPFEQNQISHSFQTIDYIEAILSDTHSGVEKPAAIILETIQAEGGINVASVSWLKGISDLCKRHGILLICDEIQVGSFRTGSFFSFERAGIVPDIVVMAKSISGYGLPMSIVLMKPEHDIWKPGEHNGTFRGNQMAFVAGSAALTYAQDINLEDEVKSKAVFIKQYLEQEIAPMSEKIEIRGLGMVWGIDMKHHAEYIHDIAAACFDKGLIIERVGRNDTVFKIMPPLTASLETIKAGCDILRDSIIQFILSHPVAAY